MTVAEGGPRAYTAAEGRELVLAQLQGLVAFWAQVDVPEREKLTGLVHSVLCIIDGVSGFLPAFKLVADPHPDDEAYHRAEGENWWPAADICEDTYLHEAWGPRGVVSDTSSNARDETTRSIT